FFVSSRRRHTRFSRDWSSDVCSSDLLAQLLALAGLFAALVGIGEASGRAAVREPDGPGGDAGAREPGIRTGGRSEEDPGTTAVLPPVPASAPPPPPPAPGRPDSTGKGEPG